MVQFQQALDRYLIIGDTKQLPPTAKAQDSLFKNQTKYSQFERLINAEYPVITLLTQYRMHPQISQ
jgi:superfamily I DNA and/or RNA helicase